MAERMLAEHGPGDGRLRGLLETMLELFDEQDAVQRATRPVIPVPGSAVASGLCSCVDPKMGWCAMCRRWTQWRPMITRRGDEVEPAEVVPASLAATRLAEAVQAHARAVRILDETLHENTRNMDLSAVARWALRLRDVKRREEDAGIAAMRIAGDILEEPNRLGGTEAEGSDGDVRDGDEVRFSNPTEVTPDTIWAHCAIGGRWLVIGATWCDLYGPQDALALLRSGERVRWVRVGPDPSLGGTTATPQAAPDGDCPHCKTPTGHAYNTYGVAVPVSHNAPCGAPCLGGPVSYRQRREAHAEGHCAACSGRQATDQRPEDPSNGA